MGILNAGRGSRYTSGKKMFHLQHDDPQEIILRRHPVGCTGRALSPRVTWKHSLLYLPPHWDYSFRLHTPAEHHSLVFLCSLLLNVQNVTPFCHVNYKLLEAQGSLNLYFWGNPFEHSKCIVKCLRGLRKVIQPNFWTINRNSTMATWGEWEEILALPWHCQVWVSVTNYLLPRGWK